MAGIYKKISGGLETYSLAAHDPLTNGLPVLVVNISCWSPEMVSEHQFRREWEKVCFVSKETIDAFEMLFPGKGKLLSLWVGTYDLGEGVSVDRQKTAFKLV